jgi:hypothetical protein
LRSTFLYIFLGFCAPSVHGNTCNVVTGVTAILLDSQSAFAQGAAYTAIQVGLNDTDFLDQFSSTIYRAQFLVSIRESLEISPDQSDHADASGSVTATVAVAAASVSFVVASIFCYGLMRRENSKSSEPRIRHKSRSSRHQRARTIGNPNGIQTMNRRFVRLGEDDSFSADPSVTFVTTTLGSPHHELTPSIAWSISDVTSDSMSIRSDSMSMRSGISRTASQLQRIEEEREEEVSYDDEGDYDDEEDYDDDDEDGSSAAYRLNHHDNSRAVPSYLHGNSRRHVELYDGEMQDESEMQFSDLEGSRYLEDSMEEMQDEIHLMVTVTPLDLSEVQDDDLQSELDFEHDFISGMRVDELDDFVLSMEDESIESIPVEKEDSALMDCVDTELAPIESKHPVEEESIEPNNVDGVKTVNESPTSVMMFGDVKGTKSTPLLDPKADLGNQEQLSQGSFDEEDKGNKDTEEAKLHHAYIEASHITPEKQNESDPTQVSDESMENYGTPMQEETVGEDDNESCGADSTIVNASPNKEALQEWLGFILGDLEKSKAARMIDY